MLADDSKGETQRLFLALWPDAAVRGAVAGLARQWVPDGRLIPPKNLHVTLAFLGDVAGEAMLRVRSLGANLEVAAFSLDLDRIGCWPRQRISWIAPSHAPAMLGRLNQELIQKLREAGFSVPGRRFAPHMTIARRSAPHAFHNVSPIVWSIERISLIRSRLELAGAHYQILCEWPLQPRNTRGWPPSGGGTSPGNMK